MEVSIFEQDVIDGLFATVSFQIESKVVDGLGQVLIVTQVSQWGLGFSENMLGDLDDVGLHQHPG